MNDPIYDRLSSLLQRRYKLEVSELSPDATVADLGLDSLFVEELMLLMPDVFGVDTTDVPSRDLTLSEISDWLREQGARP